MHTADDMEAAVLAALREEDPGGVASRLGVPERALVTWTDAYVRAGSHELRMTDVPALRGLRLYSDLTFPTHALGRLDSALVLNATTTMGRGDLIHLHDKGTPRVTCVAQDRSGTRHLTRIFPNDWTFVEESPADAVTRLAADGQRFDAVICDGPLGGATTTDALADVLAPLSTRHLVVRAAGPTGAWTHRITHRSVA